MGDGLRVGVARDLQRGVDVPIGLELNDVAARIGDLGLGLLGGLPRVIRRHRDEPDHTARRQAGDDGVEVVPPERHAEMTGGAGGLRRDLVGGAAA